MVEASVNSAAMNSSQIPMANSKSTFDQNPLDNECIKTIRLMAPMLPQQAKSGHPGAPVALAPLSHILWSRFLKCSPSNPGWWNRDRFVLSNGHACALQYTLLHLLGYDVSLDDLKQFRQVGSITPGHPELGVTPGVEVTTGPLGQGFAQGVGLAIAARHLAACYNKPDLQLFDANVFVVCGDGCLEEGISSEASSLAGTLGLSNLIVLYDSNSITIDGPTDLSFTENVRQRYAAYGWHTQLVQNGDSDLADLHRAIEGAIASNRPSFIEVRTTIGYQSPLQGTAKVHGEPFGEENMKIFRQNLQADSEDPWSMSSSVQEFYQGLKKKGDEAHRQWQSLLDQYTSKYPKEAQELKARFANQLPQNMWENLPKYTADSKPAATRALSSESLNAMAKMMPSLMGGSADLTESNKTALQGETDFSDSHAIGRYIRYGVREHAMIAITNGMAAFGGMRPFCGTFLNFYTYGWGAARLAALSKLGCLFIATHDSINLGEDGPTHQPIEVLPLCRATPNMLTMRPADGNEVAGAYGIWAERSTMPMMLCLSRGNTSHLKGSAAEKVKLGAYVLSDWTGNGNRMILAASGTEVQIAMQTREILNQRGFDCRVVSMPCWELFDEQSQEYKDSVLPQNVPRAYMEASSMFGWERWFNTKLSKGMESFGASGPAAEVYKHFGFTAENWAHQIASEQQ